MKLPILFALVACVTGAGTYAGANALGSSPPQRTVAAVRVKDTTPTAAQFAHALTDATNHFGGGRSITNAHCAKGGPGNYMCSYAVVKPDGLECHLMQGLWTPGEASEITVTLAGRVDRCDSLRAAVHSLR